MTYYFSGTIDRVIFENTSNFFKIILLEIDDTDSDFDDFEIIVTGTIADVIEGENYTFWGELTQHPKYGQQLKVERYQRAKPSSAGLIKYFSSQHFKGIGKKTAEKIIHLYGDDPIDNILEDPDKLESISGLSKANRENLVSKLRLNYGAEQILAKLAEYGLNNKTAVQIFERYKEESLTVITENPYQLVEDIQGIGFKMADKLAEQVGINSDAPQRFRAALVHTLLETSIDKGDTYIAKRSLKDYQTGSKIYYAAEQASNSFGTDKDFFVNTTTGEVYQKKNGLWTAVSDEVYIRDPKFKAALLATGDNGGTIDKNGDGKISISEVNQVVALRVPSAGITSLDGIELFVE